MSIIEEPLDIAGIITRALVKGGYIKSDSITQTEVWGLISIILKDESPEYQLCPVCKGAGEMRARFYVGEGDLWFPATSPPETCQACQGKGWVLEKSESE